MFDDFTDSVPAGYACSAAVELHFTGHYKVIDKSPTRRLVKFAKDYRLEMTAVDTKKTIRRDASGDYDERILDNGVNLDVRATGKNVYYEQGITGVLWANKKQRVLVYDLGTTDELATVIRTNGKTEDLCHAVGLRAVPGKNLPPETASARRPARIR